jgi:hypothetical protein
MCLGRDEQGEMGSPDAASNSLGANELAVPAKPAVARQLGDHYFL